MTSTSGYGAEADALAQQYESVSFSDVYRDVLDWFPAAPAAVLDVGAGTGRDAAALARLGHRVVAVEPTPQLRAHGQRLHAGAGIAWVDDSLPGLERVRSTAARFDLVLLTAVWMHLDGGERAAGMRTLRALLRPGGQVIMSLRHGPVPAGRRMYDVSAAETVALAQECGLPGAQQAGRDDPLGRAGVRWTYLRLLTAVPEDR